MSIEEQIQEIKRWLEEYKNTCTEKPEIPIEILKRIDDVKQVPTEHIEGLIESNMTQYAFGLRWYLDIWEAREKRDDGEVALFKLGEFWGSLKTWEFVNCHYPDIYHRLTARKGRKKKLREGYDVTQVQREAFLSKAKELKAKNPDWKRNRIAREIRETLKEEITKKGRQDEISQRTIDKIIKQVCN